MKSYSLSRWHSRHGLNNINGDYVLEDELISLVEWGDTYFKYNDHEAENNGIDTYICPESDDFVIQGNSIADTYSFFELNITRWVNETDSEIVWGSEDDIEEILNGIELNIAVVNSYFDFEDYDNPVRTFLDDRFRYSLVSQMERNIIVSLQENEAETKDSYFQYSPEGKTTNFISANRVDKEIRSINNESDVMMSVKFIKDYNYDSYERQVFSVLELFGSLGGLLEIFIIVGGFFVGTLSSKLFNYSVIQSLYHVDTLGSKGKASKTVLWNNTDKWLNSAEIGINEEKSIRRHETTTLPKMSDQNLMLSNYNNYEEMLKNSAKNSMLHRRSYNYSVGDYCYNLLCCCKCLSF